MIIRRLVAVAVVVLGMSAVAGAQHGGGGHGGGGGGFHGGGGGGFASRGGSGGFVSHGGGARVGGGPVGFSRPVSHGGGYMSRPGGQSRGYGPGTGVANGRPGFYHREGDRRRGYGPVYGYGGGVGYGDYGWLDANDPGDDSGYDPGYDSSAANDGSYDVEPMQEGPGVGADAYEAQGPRYAEQGAGGEEPPVPYVAEGAGTSDGEAVPAMVQRSAGPRASLYNSDAVTLMFKDGRAPEKIHNYALTRTTLFVTDGRRQEIPVASLDLAATEKVNQAAGVRFELPVTP